MTTKATVMKAIRQKCLDCACYQPSEVVQCTVYACPLHSFRFGKDPDPSRTRGFAKQRLCTPKTGQHDDAAVNG